jgi:hypothetical protein
MLTFDYVAPYPCPTGRFNLFVVATSPIQPEPGEVDVVLRYWPKWSKYVEMHHTGPSMAMFEVIDGTGPPKS